jgi:hypothetical protein
MFAGALHAISDYLRRLLFGNDLLAHANTLSVARYPGREFVPKLSFVSFVKTGGSIPDTWAESALCSARLVANPPFP